MRFYADSLRVWVSSKRKKHLFNNQWREGKDFLLTITNCLRFWHNYDSTYGIDG